jgi:hypothetical protein
MPVVSYTQKVYFRTDTTAPTSPDEIDGLRSFDFDRSVDIEETTDFSTGTGYKSKISTLRDTSVSGSGHWEAANAVQVAILTAYGSGATCYLTVHTDPSASVGSKGYRIPVLVESVGGSGAVSGVGEYSFKMAGNGAPVAV